MKKNRNQRKFTILVFVAFSIANFVLPSVPETRPMALDKCSPCNIFTEENIRNKSHINSRLIIYHLQLQRNQYKYHPNAIMRQHPFLERWLNTLIFLN